MKILIKDYVELKKITIQGVYKAIREGRLETAIENGTKYIIIEDHENRSDPEHEKKVKAETADLLNERIKHLEEMLKKEVETRERAEQREKEAITRADADKKELYKQIEQSNILQLKALETVKQLEHKTEFIEEELIKEKSKTIWQRIFKK